ncbi:DUF1449 family protein [Ornithinibacillus gellani]|uniref:DUF1449 family protein n=1 Tax=Ornithinibacillus gellani TaxID=2293253 RepID=UPI000F4950FA|nr:DUF1449 family protein [Ornithinibacillus gellani]TQS75876.1 DUF1449 family protein [Ornithinibacillus gellani]
MIIFGTPIETIYLILLIASGIITVLYLFFGDVLEGIGEVAGFLNPVLILSFITFFSAAGYILEQITSFSSVLIIIIAAVLGFILVTLLNVFVLIPMASAEESLSYTEESLKGRVGRIIIPIPEDGYGEVLIDSKMGRISKPAVSYEKQPISEGKQVLILDVIHGVLYVEVYEDELDEV